MITIELTKESRNVAKKMARNLPSKVINTALNTTIKEELRRVRTSIIKEASQTASLKSRFLRSVSGMKARKGNGVFWIASRNFILHRLGNVSQTKRGNNIIARGRALRKGVRTTERAFRINKAAVIRDRGKIRAYFAATQKPIDKAFNNNARTFRTDISRRLRSQVEFRMQQWRKQVGSV